MLDPIDKSIKTQNQSLSDFDSDDFTIRSNTLKSAVHLDNVNDDTASSNEPVVEGNYPWIINNYQVMSPEKRARPCERSPVAEYRLTK